MGRRWKWFLRPRKVVLDLSGQAVPDGDVPGRFRRGERNRGRFPTPADEVPPGGEPPRSARPDADHDLFVTPAQLARANRLADAHWRSPTEDPRTRKCPDCRADGTCPRAAWAGLIIARCLRTYRR